MSVKVEMDNWINAHTGSAFILELQAIPRVGESMRIHRDLFPETYTDGSFGGVKFDRDDDCAEVAINIVQHVVTPVGHEIRICFDFDGDFT